MPWQEYATAVTTERLGSPLCAACAGMELAHTCPYAYPVVVWTVPRQSGKTLGIFAAGIERCTTQSEHGFFYTAQTGKDGRARWNDGVKLVQRSPLKRMVQVRRSQGNERMVWPHGSELRVFAPTPDSLHGYTPPTVVIDEAFSQSEESGDALMGAIGPAQITLPDRQLWLVSTRGTDESTWFESWVTAGRNGAEGVALLDWGAKDGVDVYDPDELVNFHPALGLERNNGVTVDAIMQQAEKLSRSEFERAYGNRRGRARSAVIPPGDWRQLGGVQVAPADPRQLTLVYAVAADGGSATVAAVWRDGADMPQAKLVRWAPGHDWVADEVAEYAERWRPRGLASPSNAPTRDVTAKLARMRGSSRPLELLHNVRQLTPAEYAQAWSSLLEQVRTAGFGHDGSPQLADAAACVVDRQTETGRVPSWKASPGDISPIVSVMVGLWVQDTLPAGSQLPDMRHR